MEMGSPHRHIPIIVLLTAALVVGLFTAPHYGQSWDEADIYRYSRYALGAYAFILHPGDLAPFDTNLNLYGPAYYMAANILAGALIRLIPAWTAENAWHFVYFLTFLGGALALYLLSRRWLSELGATTVALLYLSQPLLWGHAFINPKDIPFMSFFIGAIYSGLKMVDNYRESLKLNARVIVAALLLGWTMSFRVLGPLAGLLVLAYAAYTLRCKAAGMALPYLGLSLVTAYLTWPYLWSGMPSHYEESITTMAQFPFASNILFGGQIYKANGLPWDYFPTLLGIQLTEPMLALVLFGLASSTLMWLKKGVAGPLALFLGWFLLPALIILALGSPLYDNARQLYFLLPPLFILAGTAVEQLFALLSHPLAKAGLILLAALPGILISIRLHPYEYVYYNALVGGTGGAYRKFEMDYWGISFKEITDYLNATAPLGANVLVYGPEQVVEQYARPDLHIYIPADQPLAVYDYVAFLTRANVDERRCKGTEPVKVIERRGAVLSVLKRVPRDADCR